MNEVLHFCKLWGHQVRWLEVAILTKAGQCIKAFEGFVELGVRSWDEAMILGVDQGLDEDVKEIDVKLLRFRNESVPEL